MDRSEDPRKVLSDTEAELTVAQSNKKVEEVTWQWGELPQVRQ